MSTRINHYVNEDQRKRKQPAGVFMATKWCNALETGTWWAMPAGLARSSSTMIIATTRSGESFYVGALPKGVTYA